MGAHPITRRSRQSACLEGEQLQPARGRPTNRQGPPTGKGVVMLTSERAGALRREMMAARHIPCSAHVSTHVVKTTFGDYLQVFRLSGASFESADDEQLNTWHERLNVLWRNIASPNVALWTHIIRRRERCVLTTEPAAGFAEMLAAKY